MTPQEAIEAAYGRKGRAKVPRPRLPRVTPAQRRYMEALIESGGDPHVHQGVKRRLIERGYLRHIRGMPVVTDLGRRMLAPPAKRISEGEELFAQQVAAYVAAGELPEPKRQSQMMAGRDFAFDFAWADVNSWIDRNLKTDGAWYSAAEDGLPDPFDLAVEIDGAVHRTKERFADDREKFNLAEALDWRVYHFTPAEVRAGKAIDAVLAIFADDDAALLKALQRKA